MYVEDERHPFMVVLDYNDNAKKIDMWRWCVDLWGRPAYNNTLNWVTRNDENGYIFKFEHEKDRTLFLLRWN